MVSRIEAVYRLKNCNCKDDCFRFFESVHEIELIIVKLINESMTKAVTIEQMVDILEIFTDFQQRTVRIIREDIFKKLFLLDNQSYSY
jgi:hypothetical protein